MSFCDNIGSTEQGVMHFLGRVLAPTMFPHRRGPRVNFTVCKPKASGYNDDSQQISRRDPVFQNGALIKKDATSRDVPEMVTLLEGCAAAQRPHEPQADLVPAPRTPRRNFKFRAHCSVLCETCLGDEILTISHG
ncbi:hypothetical protein POX_h09735 [Penicillium oxalicum]|uniref:hypothetical protein n=1 Tax=Penicillium oxalicum TaxID=69781 RepID=UPI0020B66F41|nr:hypothetical protein POX_h09735 [Penicillium oxalicum]KAI2785970.1 hypothetical protein POX_h09735 [Penicillium oxalicum]